MRFLAAFALLTTLLVPGVAPAQETPRFELPPLPDFSATVERPLFSPTRRGTVDPAPEPTTAIPVVAAPVDQGSYRLIGFAADADGRAVALLLDLMAGGQLRLLPGDAVNGWRIDGVTDGALLLVAGPETRRVVMGEPIPPSP